MKKNYETPVVNKISFNYKEQVVAESGSFFSGGQDNNRTPGSNLCDIRNSFFGMGICGMMPLEE